jgi:hypothetical protein
VTTTLSPTAPIAVGTPVTVRRAGDAMPGTVVTVRALPRGGYEVRAQVLTRFGVAISRHVLDRAGHEVEHGDGYLEVAHLAIAG